MEQNMTMHESKNRNSRPDFLYKKEGILAVLLITMAYLYLSVIRYPTELARLIWWKAQLNTEYFRVGLAWMIFTIMFLAIGLWYAGIELKKLQKDSWIYFALTTAAGVWFPFYMKGDQDVVFFMGLFLHGAAVYWLLSMTGSIRGIELDERGAGDLLRGFFVLPFSGYPEFFVTGSRLGCFLWQSKNAKNSKVWQIVLGLLISLPVLCIAIPILRGADAYFDFAADRLLQGLFEVIQRWDLVSLMFTAVWTLALAGYFFGLFYRANHKKIKTISNVDPSVLRTKGEEGEAAEEQTKQEIEKYDQRQLPYMVMASFLLPILILYLLFFGIRLLGISGAMDQISAGELWISTYAREGFFELCWIATINFVIFTVVRWFSSQDSKGMRILISGLGVETMAFVTLAFSKMWYYIQAYESFTFKRAMCCWLLLTLLVTFGLMTLELWKKKIKGIKWGVWFGSVTFLLMAYSNMPAWAP